MYFTYRTKRYKVEQDAYNLILQKHHTRKAKDGTSVDEWKVVGYYSSLTYLLRKLLKEGVFDEKESKNLVKSFNEATKSLAKQLDAILKDGTAS